MHSLHTGRVGAKVLKLYGWNYPIRPEGAGAHISSTPLKGQKLLAQGNALGVYGCEPVAL